MSLTNSRFILILRGYLRHAGLVLSAGIIFFASYVSQLKSYHFPIALLSLQVAAPLSQMKYLFHAPASVMDKLSRKDKNTGFLLKKGKYSW